MRIKNKILCSTIAASIFASSACVYAMEDSKYSVGLSVGGSMVTTDYKGENTGTKDAEGKDKDKDPESSFGIKANVNFGYLIMDNFSIGIDGGVYFNNEITYKYQKSVQAQGNKTTVEKKMILKPSILTVGAYGAFDIPVSDNVDLGLTAKIGLSRVSAEVTEENAKKDENQQTEDKITGLVGKYKAKNNLLAGIGARVSFKLDSITLGAEYGFEYLGTPGEKEGDSDKKEVNKTKNASNDSKEDKINDKIKLYGHSIQLKAIFRF